MNVLELSSLMSKPEWALNAQRVMKQKGIRQADLLEVFDVTTTGSVAHYFNGRRDPGPEKLVSLADFLGITTSQLFGTDQTQGLNGCTGKDLEDAIALLLRVKKVKDEDAITFLKVVKLLGSEDIVKAAVMIRDQSEDGNISVSNVLRIQDYFKTGAA